MEEKIGPSFELSISCFGCKFLTSEYYRVQGDSGYDNYCTHTKFHNKKYIGDSKYCTPDFCPLLSEKLKEFLEEKLK